MVRRVDGRLDVRSASRASGVQVLDVEQLLHEVAAHHCVSLGDQAPADLLERAIVLREDDTLISGMIRVLELDAAMLVQEQTPEGQVLVRAFESREAADAFVDDRLATYDRMWDGCGCKVRYFDET